MFLAADGNIVSTDFSYAGNSMRKFKDYRYYLREEGGKVLYDARCYVERYGYLGLDSHAEVNVENAVVSRVNIDEVVEICGGNSALSEQQREYIAGKSSVNSVPPVRINENRPRDMELRDGPVHREEFTVRWENGAELFVPSLSDNSKPVVFNYLDMLAIRLALPPAEGNVVSCYFYGRDGVGSFDNYSYALYEYGDEILFDANYAVGGQKRQHNRVAVGLQDFEELQAICERSSFAEAQQTYRPVLPADSEAQTFIEVNWKNGAALKAMTAFGGEDVLKAYFFDLAIRLEK